MNWLKRHWLDLWLWWIVVTAVYLLLQINIFAARDSLLPLAGFIGLFVPIGIWNFLGGIGNFPFDLPSDGTFLPYLTIPLVLLIVFGSEQFLKRWARERVSNKIILNLLTLWLLTVAVDFLLWYK